MIIYRVILIEAERRAEITTGTHAGIGLMKGASKEDLADMLGAANLEGLGRKKQEL